MSRKKGSKRESVKKPAAEASGKPQGGPRRYRWVIRLGILLVAGVALLLWAATHRTKNGLTIENRSGQTITSLEVTAAGTTTHFTQVPSGTTVFAPFGTEDATRDAAARAVSAWSLVARSQLRQSIGAGPIPYLLEVAASTLTPRAEPDDLFAIEGKLPGGGGIRARGKLGDHRTLVILPRGEIKLE